MHQCLLFYALDADFLSLKVGHNLSFEITAIVQCSFNQLAHDFTLATLDGLRDEIVTTTFLIDSILIVFVYHFVCFERIRLD